MKNSFAKLSALLSLFAVNSLFAQEETTVQVTDSTSVQAVVSSDTLAATDSTIAANNAISEPTQTAEAIPAAPVQEQVAEANSQAEPENFTELSSDFSGFLTSEHSPYLAKESIVIPEGKALIIAAGVTVKFEKGAGIDVRGGIFTIAGEQGKTVKLKPKAEGETWNGISITGAELADINNAEIEGADVAFDIENGGADIRNTNISGFATAGVFVKNSNASIQNSSIEQGKGTAIRTGDKASVELEATSLNGNKIAILAGSGSEIVVNGSSIKKNEYGLLDMGDNNIKEHGSKIEENKVGYIADDLPSDELKAIIQKNDTDLTNGATAIAKTLPEEPENPFAKNYRPVKKHSEQVAETQKEWSLNGTVSSLVGYHLVRTRHNYHEAYVSSDNVIERGDRYENYFQTPGLFAGYNAYLKLESPNGHTLEFTTNLASDHWNEFKVNTLNVTYTDSLQKVSLGDSYLSAGETYLAGTNLFGVAYDINLLKISSGQPMFQLSLFAGETQKPKLVGKKNPDIYKDYIEDGEGEPQEVLAGGKLTWNMHRRFNGTLGFIGSKSYKHDPILRDGMTEDANTSSLLMDSKTFFADGNWLFWPGDIELNGQIAFGAADTADVAKQRAINKVFSNAGLSVSNFALLRKLMNAPDAEISRLRKPQLEEIFGDNTSLSESEMKELLRKLIQEAKQVLASTKKSDEPESDISDWDGDNIAAAASLRWVGKKTAVVAHFKFTGSEFYSAGSPDQLSNAREFGLNIDQKIFDFWKLSLAYDFNVENAGTGNQYNIFGLREGTTFGLLNTAHKSWMREHELDENRAQYINDGSIKNVFNLGQFEVTAKYGINYRTRNKPTRLYGTYSVESGIYDDPWFKSHGQGTIKIPTDTDTLTLDSANFEKYYALSSQKFLASGFEEKLLKHTAELQVAVKLPKNLLRIGGIFTYRTDLSEFENDSLTKGLDFSNESFGLLGYYFHGGDFIEQRYPISLTSTFDAFRNEFSVTPRIKNYKRDSEQEIEYTINETLEFPIIRDFVELSLNGSYRQEFISRDGSKDETEADIDGSLSVRVYFTNNFYSDYTLGAYYNYRPDSRADEYRDYYGIFALSYEF